MQHKLATWASADQTRRFDRLLRLITDRNWLAEAARIGLASSGASTPGLDGMGKRRLAALEHHARGLAGRELSSNTGQANPYPEGQWQAETTGYTDLAGPHRPAGDADGHGADLGE